MFDKKKIRKSIIILLLIAIIIVAIILIRRTLARYETTATSDKDVDVAFWIINSSFKSGTILIQDIYPSDNSFDYTFTISNFEDTKKAETDLSYGLVLTTTTNLPLEYEIQKNGVTCQTTEDIYADEDGTYYRELKIDTESNNLIMYQGTDSTDTYKLKVTFPKANNTNAEFSDLIEYIKLDLTAKQLIE